MTAPILIDTSADNATVITYGTDNGRKQWRLTIDADGIFAEYRVSGIDRWYIEGMIPLPNETMRHEMAKALEAP